MGEKKSLLSRRDTSTWTAYILISLTTIASLYYGYVAKEDKKFQSYMNEAPRNIETLSLMRKLYAENVEQKMQQHPDLGSFSAVAAVHDDFKKQFSEKDNDSDKYFNPETNKDKPLSPAVLEQIVFDELEIFANSMPRKEFKQLLMVYPYMKDKHPIWKKNKTEEVQARIGKYENFILEKIKEGVGSRTRQ